MNRTASAAMHRTCVAYRVMLTSETNRQIKSAFDTLDSNRDGLLTREDWTQLERFLADRTPSKVLPVTSLGDFARCGGPRVVAGYRPIPHRRMWKSVPHVLRTAQALRAQVCAQVCERPHACIHARMAGGRFPRIGQSHRVARGLRR